MQTQPVATKQEFIASFGSDVRQGRIQSFKFQSLKSFSGWLRNLPPVENKIESKYLVGARFSDHTRTLNTLVGATFLQLDFDKPLSPEHQSQVSALLTAEGIGHVSFETFSNGGKFVTIIPLSRLASPAEHKATMNHVIAELGAYAAGLDQASFNPVLPRFVSPNAANSNPRNITLVELPFLVPIPSAEDFDSLPDNVQQLRQQAAPRDAFEAYCEQPSPAQKDLFLAALRGNCIAPKRLIEYKDWFPVLFAGFRAWDITGPELTESHRELIEALDLWSQFNSEHYKPGCVQTKLRDWLRDRDTSPNRLHIHSILSEETDTAALKRQLILEGKEDLLKRDTGATTVLSQAELDAASNERELRLQELNTLRLRASCILASMPTPTPRMAAFADLLTDLVTQGQAEHWELTETEWPYFLRPAPMLIGLLQIAAMGFAPHVMFRTSPSLPPKALNPYFLNIAKAGTGKSVGVKILERILGRTVFKVATCNTKLHSATGLWVNFFEKCSAQLVFSEEAEALIGKGAIDQHLGALHTALKQLFDGAIPGVGYRPSAQVQRQINEVVAPWCSLHLAGTPVLLNEHVSAEMLQDGFISRLIVSIDERDQGLLSEEQLITNKLAVMNMTGDKGGLEQSIARTGGFLNRLWRDGHHPLGSEFFTLMPDSDPAEMVERIVTHFVGCANHARYISFPEDDASQLKFATLMVRAESRWAVPESLRNTITAANIESARARAETKLLVLSSLLTLVSNPEATVLDYDLAEWAEEFLYVVQHQFYLHLIRDNAVLTTSGKWSMNEEMLSRLRPAVMPGGPLYAAPMMGRDVREINRAWRILTGDLGKPVEHPKHRAAIDLLEALSVERVTDGKKITYIYTGDA